MQRYSLRGAVGYVIGGSGMVRFLVKRILTSLVVLMAIVFGAFILIRLIPGGPFNDAGHKQRDAQSLANLQARYGLDKPLLLNLPNDGIAPDWNMETRTNHEVLPDCDKLRQGIPADKAKNPNAVVVEQGWYLLRMTEEHRTTYIDTGSGAQRCDEVRQVLYSDLARSQFLQYLDNVLRFDFGLSLGSRYRDQPVRDIIGKRLPVSMQLGALAAFFGFVVGIPLGVVAAVYRNSVVDYSATLISVAFVSVPSFVLAPALLIVVVNQWHLLPGPDPTVWLKPNYLDWDFLSRLILPLLTLTLGVSAGIARLTRASLLQVLQEDYVRTARSKGMRERGVIYIHALKNALIPVATILGPLLAGILTGTFFVELIFAIPGLGSAFLDSIQQRDYTLLTGTTILYATFLVFGNILVDIMYTWLDPRIRFD
jgi:ABC-type dipeptide/oligopeptide/nickel transport system permease component